MKTDNNILNSETQGIYLGNDHYLTPRMSGLGRIGRSRVIDTTGWNFGDESPKLDFTLEDFMDVLEKEEQKSDTAITHDDFNASVVVAAQTTVEEQCSKYLVSTPQDLAASDTAVDFTEFWSDLELREEDVNKMADANFFIPNVLVRGHLLAYIAIANGGKTTLFRYFCELLSGKNLKVFYINVDGNTGDLKRHYQHADKFGYKVISPDSRDGKNTGDALVKLRALADSNYDLSDHVYIIDTLKKFVDMLNKSKLKETLQMFRKLSVKGATIVLLCHANKYPDKDGNLVYEGTADLRNDVDELIYLNSSKDETNNTQDITTKPDKVRASFEPVSYRILLGEDRKVCLLDAPLKSISQADKELSSLIIEAISSGDDSQSAITNYVRDRSSLGINKIRTFLIDRSKGEDALWVSTPTGSNNALRYSMVLHGILPI
jgi:hypothetical protein